ncbi:hypothetical protein KAI54_02340, partial [Candidatus Gracilibacteria bacterium]|nr:hypothetical protein [Candidatus Gracilibacteria bacterium]
EAKYTPEKIETAEYVNYCFECAKYCGKTNSEQGMLDFLRLCIRTGVYFGKEAGFGKTVEEIRKNVAAILGSETPQFKTGKPDLKFCNPSQSRRSMLFGPSTSEFKKSMFGI